MRKLKKNETKRRKQRKGGGTRKEEEMVVKVEVEMTAVYEKCTKNTMIRKKRGSRKQRA